jgi:hypothetical protein
VSLPISTVKAALQDWLTDATGWTVIWQFQNAPEPGSPFVSINPVLTSRRIGMDDEQIWQAAGTVQIVPYRRIVASVQACGADALSKLSNAIDQLERPNLYAGWFTARALAAYTGDLRNLTGLKNGRYEQRAQFDVTITGHSDPAGFTDDLGYFDHLTYDSPALGIPDTTIPD